MEVHPVPETPTSAVSRVRCGRWITVDGDEAGVRTCAASVPGDLLFDGERTTS
jgi:hypothetical protein